MRLRVAYGRGHGAPSGIAWLGGGGKVKPTIEAVIFDMDGLLVDSEVYWEASRREFCARHGCEWTAADENGVKGMNSLEWAAAITDRCGFDLSRREVVDGVVELMAAQYDRRLPLLPGAVEAVRAAAGKYRVALASSSPQELIERVLEDAAIRSCFAVTVSADSIGKGKPAPDVFLAAAHQLGVRPEHVAVVEDSTAGIRAGIAAGMRVIAVPNPHNPPDRAVLIGAFAVLSSLEDFRLSLFEV